MWGVVGTDLVIEVIMVTVCFTMKEKPIFFISFCAGRFCFDML